MASQAYSQAINLCTDSKTRTEIREDFIADSIWKNWTCEALSADASFRRYFRLTNENQSVLLMDAPPESEDLASYIKIDQYLLSMGLRAPKIYKSDLNDGFAIIEDFGLQTYTQLLDSGEEAEPLYKLAVDVLAKLHKNDTQISFDIPRYDDGYYQEEAELLIDWYWPARTGKKISTALRDEYLQLWQQLLAQVSTKNECLILRDYHVDNLMITGSDINLSSCGLLDFQDALIGPKAYDFVSLFEDARRDVDADMAKRLMNGYLANIDEAEHKSFTYDYHVLGAHRHVKVVGIFVRLCIRDNKAHYLSYLPRVQNLLEHALQAPEMAPLQAWFKRHHPQDITEPLLFDTEKMRALLC